MHVHTHVCMQESWHPGGAGVHDLLPCQQWAKLRAGQGVSRAPDSSVVLGVARVAVISYDLYVVMAYMVTAYKVTAYIVMADVVRVFAPW